MREGFSAKARSRKHPRTHFRALRKQIKTSGRLETADTARLSRVHFMYASRDLKGVARDLSPEIPDPFPIPTRRRYRGREIDGFDALRN